VERSGYDFNPLNDTVTFYNGVTATVTAASAGALTVQVPSQAATGPITVTTAGGLATSASFTVVPKILSLNSTQGAEGAAVIITGTTFLASDTVKFNGVAVTGGTTTGTTHSVNVPTGATTGTVTVTTVGGYTTTSSQTYTVVPKILSLNGTSGAVGSPVTINGTTFLSSDTVKFNGLAVTGGTTTATTHIVNVPVGATTGTVTVTTVGGYTDTSAQIFTVTAVPNPPTLVIATKSSGNAVTVTWVAATTGAPRTYYTLDRSTSASGPTWTSVNANIGASATSAPDAVPGVGMYFYRLASCNTAGCSAYVVSSAVNIPLPALPAPVTDTVPTHDATVGTMAGQAGVDGGAATYTVLIEVPPGRAGMQPSLSLNYNSRSGNGVMGVGWSLSGTSSVHRCPQTPEQDGQTLGVSYKSTDRLCLDGQRLVTVPGSADYGTAGAEYRTEVDSYARIYQVGGSLTDTDTVTPTCFRVEQKDGRILHYGGVIAGTAPALTCTIGTSRVLPQGVTRPLSWLVEKIEDRVGNNQLYAYTNVGNGEVLLNTVSYTGFTTGGVATAGNRTVTFTYEPRASAASGVNDISSSFLAGGLSMQTQALQAVTTRVGGVIARVYQPSYVSSLYSQRLLMASMQECAGSGCSPTQTSCSASTTKACHPATVFTYNDSALQYPLTSLSDIHFTLNGGSLNANVLVPYQLSMVADFDGDGTREAIASVHEADGNHTFVVQLTSDRVAHSAVEIPASVLTTAGGYADLGGDGRSEVIMFPAAGGVQKLSFGVWNLPRGVVATSNPFTTVASNIDFVLGQVTDIYAADMNGDGKVDIVVVQPTSNCTGLGVFVWLNALPSGPLSTTGTLNFTPANNGASLFCMPLNPTTSDQVKIDHIADFDGNGLPDFYLSYGSGQTNLAGAFYGIRLTTQITATSASLSALSCDDAGFLTSDECSNNGGLNNKAYYTRWMDINGDGLEDFVIARPGESWQVRLNQGGGSLRAAIDTGSTAGLDIYATGGTPVNAFKYLGRFPAIDADGDGKPDILIPSTTQGTHGFALKICSIVRVTKLNPMKDGLQCPLASTMPTVLPQNSSTDTSNPPICSAYACPPDPGSSNVSLPINTTDGEHGPDQYPYQWPDEHGNLQPAFDLYNDGAPHSGTFLNADNSSYHLAMLKFVQTGPSTITLSAPIETPIISRTNAASVGPTPVDDLFGDGLPDVISFMGCTSLPLYFAGSSTPSSATLNTCRVVGDGTYGPAYLPDGAGGTSGIPTAGFNVTPVLYASVNQGAAAPGGSLALITPSKAALSVPAVTATTTGTPVQPLPTMPGLMYTATNGLGDQALWQIEPLSVPLSQGNGELPFYGIASGGYVDNRHYYFASSMPAVSGLFQSDGIGGIYGFRGAAYGYTEAMYNHLGRGFQGFHTITAWITTPDTTRSVRTTTTYKQKFPLAGKVASVETRVPYTHTLIQSETDTWACASNRSACPDGTALGNVVYQPVLDTQSVKQFDLTADTTQGAQYAQVDTVNGSAGVSGWDSYGNLKSQTITRQDVGTAAQNYVGSHVTTTTHTFAAADIPNWWVNQLNDSTVASSMTYTANHPLPISATTPSVKTVYTWNPNRTPWTQTIQGTVTDQRSITTYSYPTPSFGLPSTVSIMAPDLDAAHSPTRSTSYIYTKDGTNAATAADGGYFVLNTTNSLSQTTTTQHQTSDGQVILIKDPNNLQTTTTYDVFGRPTQISYLDSGSTSYASATNLALNACNGVSCPGGGIGEGGDETNAAYRMTMVRAGYPTQVVWYDLLGRAIKHAQRGYTGTLIETNTDYDAHGTIQYQSVPFYSGSGAVDFIGYSYDRLNRPLQKIEPGLEMDINHGDRVTDYRYSGRTTNITVYANIVTPDTTTGACPSSVSPVNLCMNMSRSKNVLGQYMQTVDAANGTTNYWTEPQGHVVAIQDAESNLTTALYNALGQRTASSDPDQGAWTFAYDAFGELTSQTDARGLVTTVNSRDALGRTTQQQQVPPASVPNGMANQTLLDDWSYDPANGIGELDTVTRKRGSGRTVPTATTPVWSEQTGYDTVARPTTITTTINETGAVSLASGMTYDSNGRPNTHTYPSGLIVQTQYGAYGHPGAIANGSGQIYWEATAMDAWGKVTGESYVDGTKGVMANYASSGQQNSANWTLNSSTVDKLDYTYDSFGNLTSQKRTVGSASNTENYVYDVLQRLSKSMRSANGAAVNYAYTASGNLKYKDDFSTNTGTGTPAYSYGSTVGSSANACGPHGAMSVSLPVSGTATYQCDASGNVIGGNMLSAVYDADNHPRSVNRIGAGSTSWAYDANGNRDFENTVTQGVRYFGPGGYEQVGNTSIHELGPVIVTRTSGVDTITVALRDRLGSTIDTIDGGVPRASSTRSYDAFGAVRNGDLSSRSGGTLNLGDTIHGFTQHEHADDVRLIHMGGRIYDYTLGRFLNVDPIIGNPMNSQSLNPYSYIGNNPLSGTDPTGYESEAADTRSICFASLSGCGAVSNTDSVAALTASSQGADRPGTGGSGRVTQGTQLQGSVDTKSSDVGKSSDSGAQPSSGAPAKDAPDSEGSKGKQAGDSKAGMEGFVDLGVMGQFYDGKPIRLVHLGEDPLTGENLDRRTAGMLPLVAAGQQFAQCVTGGSCTVAEVGLATAAVVLPEVKALRGGGTSTLELGPYAAGSISARSAARDFTAVERSDINRIGQATGCHTCGTTNPGTKRGNFVPDHQPVSALNSQNAAQKLYPHCIDCSRRQGGQVLQELLKEKP
jgi:RHS repeat-associated protein